MALRPPAFYGAASACLARLSLCDFLDGRVSAEFEVVCRTFYPFELVSSVGSARNNPRPKCDECPRQIGPATGFSKVNENSPAALRKPSSPDLFGRARRNSSTPGCRPLRSRVNCATSGANSPAPRRPSQRRNSSSSTSRANAERPSIPRYSAASFFWPRALTWRVTTNGVADNHTCAGPKRRLRKSPGCPRPTNWSRRSASARRGGSEPQWAWAVSRSPLLGDETPSIPARRTSRHRKRTAPGG